MRCVVAVRRKVSSFQLIILELIRDELNMMLCETFQLKKKVDYNDFELLTKIILKEIANSHIISPHLTPKKARQYIKILDTLNCQQKIGDGLNRFKDGVYADGISYSEDANPYSDLPSY